VSAGDKFRFTPQALGEFAALLRVAKGAGAKSRDAILERVESAAKKAGASTEPLVLEISRTELGACKVAILEFWDRPEVQGADRALARRVSISLRIWGKQIAPILDKRESESDLEPVDQLDDESDELDAPEPEPQAAAMGGPKGDEASSA
jgi:hypothetical protein